MEIYVRINDDFEKDYAFQVEKEDTFEDKILKIFSYEKGLAKFMALRPSIFYMDQPSELYKSTHPGFLTENGCLLFDYEADEEQYLELLDTQKEICNQLWPGQLVIPKFEKSWPTIVGYVIIMLAWLYTDLPDVISPTPGICLTNQVSRVFIILTMALNYPHIATKLAEEIEVGSTGVVAQWIFFALHIIKLVVITFFFYTGTVNPISFNPLSFYRTRSIIVGKNNKELTDILKSVGWIGARRAPYDAYRDVYYNYEFEKAGGAVAAYKLGILKKAAQPGVALTAGEGFQTPLKERFGGKTFAPMEESQKFLLSEEYFVQLEKDLKENINKCEDDVPKINAEIRRFRRFGLFESSEKLTRLVQLRKESALKIDDENEPSLKEKKNQ